MLLLRSSCTALSLSRFIGLLRRLFPNSAGDGAEQADVMSHVRQVLCQPNHSMATAGSGGLLSQDRNSVHPACSHLHEALHGCAPHLLLGSHLSVCQATSCSAAARGTARLQSLALPVSDTSNTAKDNRFAAGDCQHAHAPRLQWLGHRDLLQRLQFTRARAIPYPGLQVPQLQQLQHKEAQRRQDQCTVCSRLQQRSNNLVKLAYIVEPTAA